MFKVTKEKFILYSICFIFFLAYTLLSVIRHLHYGSFGYDLGIADQIVWEYSNFQAPITTIDHIPFISELFVHVELIYILLAPFYWIYTNVITLIVLQSLCVTASGIPIYLLARKHGLTRSISYALVVSYLTFFGIQNALWFDVHSTVFGASFLAWFIYFLDSKYGIPTYIFFFLTIICKENYAAMTLLVSLVYLLYRREKRQVVFIGLSALYLLIIFGVYFHYFVPGGYRFQSSQGLFGGMSLLDFANTSDKRQVIGYTVAWTGLLSFLEPVFLIPLIGNLASYFILGRDVVTAQGLFLQYRIELAPLLLLSTIYGIKRFKKLNTGGVAVYLLVCAFALQYTLHLPLSYLTKKYFWQQPASVTDINSVLSSIPGDASVVSQNNIIPHISHRKNIFTLWPEKKSFISHSPCKETACNWFRWSGNPRYLVVDTADDWDIRHLLTNKDDYIDGLHNLEKAGVITKYKNQGSTELYVINKNP